MSEETKVVETQAEKDFNESFTPAVHRIGRITMAIAFVLAFLPVIFFVLVQGHTAPLSAYVSVTIAISSIGIGMWISEPLAYWPVLGSAGTYIGYLSGNVGAMRFPVALNLQSAMKADINTPRGQIVTIVGIVASVFANLVLLLIFVLGGSWLISLLPDVVMASFAFVMNGLMGCMLTMRWNSEGGFVKGVLSSLPYILVAVGVKLLEKVFPPLMFVGMAVAVVLNIFVAYIIYKRDCKKDEQEAASK